MRNIDSHTDSIAESFAERAQSSLMVSSRASLLHNDEQGYDAAQQIAQFRVQIQKRFIMSVANKYYSFPLTELSFDNPFQDQQLSDLIGKDTLCLLEMDDQNERQHNKDNDDDRQIRNNRNDKLVDVGAVLKQLKADRQKFTQILQLINNRKNTQTEDRHSKSKQKRIAYKYGAIREQDEQVLRKRLLTQPNQKATGFIIKKK